MRHKCMTHEHFIKGHKFEDWMSKLPEQLWDVPLYNLAIPGSHDTMSYCLDINSPIDKSGPKILNLVDKIFPCFVRPQIYKWSTTQEKNIVEQLDAGIRYFDLRISHKDHDTSSNLYFSHGLYTLLSVKEVLTFIAQWLENHQKEVVILACSHFQGMTEDLHKHLISLLKNIFDAKLCLNSETVTLWNIWKLGHQVIVSYDNPIAKQHCELWPGISYWWADSMDPKAVVQYMINLQKIGRPGTFFVAGLNLTENWKFILTHLRKSMKTLTFKAYPFLMSWVRKQTPGSDRACLNIIAGDFIGLYDMVPQIISLNTKLLMCIT
ncbi:PI-PLC X domain-containing protein 1-like isoform X2 [Erpetoichthys calabaricus]|nr:PI-PLC X domain-containing protein 1-like isoform X2 [Erpetoichthys calabaricus]